jgi:superfamily II DNA or RNA helicase
MAERYDPNKTIIERASHYFVVKNPTRAIVPIVYRLAADYTEHAMEFDPIRKRKVWRPAKTYGVHARGGREFRFHKNQWHEFEQALRRDGIYESSYEIVERQGYAGKDVALKMRDGWKLRADQENANDFIQNGYENGENAPLLMMPTGSGKPQPLDAKIKVPGGWTTMGEVQPGQYVTAWDGTPTLVTGVYPQGTIPIVKITFEDGRSTECGIRHLWRIHTSTKEHWTRVVPTIEIARLLKLNHYKDRIYIDLPVAEDGPAFDLPMDPYALGLLLGDGGFCHKRVDFSKDETSLVKSIAAALPKGMKVVHRHKTTYSVVSEKNKGNRNNLWLTIIRDLGLDNKRSFEKFIPDVYFHGSFQQRLALIQGLLDTDGTVDRLNGTISFTSTSKRLAEGFQYLIRSIGGLAKMTERTTHYSCKGEKKAGRRAYTIFVRYKKPSELFRLERKRIRTNDENQYAKNLRLRVRSVELIEHKEAKCIAIDHPDHLYVTDDFIVTHNTVTSMAAVARRGKRFAVIILGGYVDKWIGDITGILELEKKQIAIVQGTDSLIRSTLYPGSDVPTPPAFIISINTIQKWYKLYEENHRNPKLEEFGCKPWEFFEHLGIGTVVFDEAHQHPHAVYKCFAYMHVPLAVSLSATMLTKNPVLKKVQSMMYPLSARFEEIKMGRYITSWQCVYQITDFDRSRLRTTEWGSTSYSHVAYEQSILEHRTVLPQYLKMLVNLVKSTYIKEYIEKDKAIIFVARKSTAELLQKVFKKEWPERDIRTYLQEDGYENVIEADIIISTVLSGGTALDIPNLRRAYLTIAIDSPNSNAQVLGRLRNLKDRDVHFYWLTCSTIAKHEDYAAAKVELFKDRTKEQKRCFLATIVP